MSELSSKLTHRSVWQIALPLMVSNITIPLLGMVDAFVVGHLDSAHYLSAVSLGATLFSFVFLGFNFLRMSTTGFTAQAIGELNHRQTIETLIRACIIACVIALFLIVLQHPIVHLALFLFGAEQNVSQLAQSYCFIRIYAAPASLINIVLIGWFIGLQNSRVPMLLMLLVNVINILLDLFFVMVLDLKADGVALASVIAEYSGMAAGLLIVARQVSSFNVRNGLAYVWQLSKFRLLMSVNSDLFIRTIALQFAFAFFTAMSARQGSVILAANAVLLNFQTLTSYALDGFANAAEALVGKAVGQKNSTQIRQAVSLSRYWAVAIAILLTLLFLFIGQLLIDAITDLQQVRLSAKDFLAWLIISPLISVWCFLYDGVFVGAVMSRQMRNIMLASCFLIFLPSWWALQHFGNHGLWLSLLIFMGARGILMHLSWRRFELPH